MKFTGKAAMSFGLMATTAYMVITAMAWPFKTALFPMAIGIPVFCMATAVFFMDLLGTEKKKSGSSPVVDFQLSQSKDASLTMKRTVEIFSWIIGFFLLILLVGFSLSIPTFFVAFLRFKGKESWKLTIILSGIAWAFFYGLFVWLLDTPFMDGWLQRGLMAVGILK